MAVAAPQIFSINRFSLFSGNRSSGGSFVLESSVGQPDGAIAQSGGSYAVNGGILQRGPLATPTLTNTPPPNSTATFTPTPTATGTSFPTATQTRPATVTPVPPGAEKELFLSLINRAALSTIPPTATPIPCLTAEIEPNNQTLQIIDHPPICIDGTRIVGTISSSGDSDIYRVTLAEPRPLFFILTNIPDGQDYNLELFDDQSAQAIGNSGNTGNDDEIIDIENIRARNPSKIDSQNRLIAGNYFIRVVSNSSGSSQNYNLIVSSQ